MAALNPSPSVRAGNVLNSLSVNIRGRLNQTSIIAHIAFITCILLQRFGIPFGDGELSISVPVFFLLGVWMLVSGQGGISTRNAFLFLILATWGVFCAFIAVLAPDPRVGFSVFSVLEFLVLYALMAISPTKAFDGSIVQRVFLFYVRICAVAGIIQFGLQLVGIRLFSFRSLIPALDPWLLEKYYAWNPVLHYGSSTLRSNGFFLLEPSIFSQFLGVAVLLDFFILGRRRYLPLYIAGYMVSYSGSGFLALALTLALIGMTSLRSSGRVVMFTIAAAIILAVFSAMFPLQVGTYLGRVAEFKSTTSSGHARYIAPFQEIQAFKGETRNLIGYGPGATMRSRFYIANSGNALLQLFMDYGIIGILLFYSFLVAVLWRTRYAALSIILLINFELGGGYLLFAPLLLMMAVLGVWSTGEAPAAFAPGQRIWNVRPAGARRFGLAKA